MTFPQVVYCIARYAPISHKRDILSEQYLYLTSASSLSCITIASVVSVKSRHQWRIITAETWEEGVGIVCDNDVAVLLGSLFVISAATNSFLMFLRVRAIFSHSRPTVIAFGLLWAATLCGASTVLFLSSNHSDWNFLTGDDGGISGLQSCSDINFSPFVISAYMSSAAYDATLFLAITCRLLFYHLYCDGSTSRLKSFFNGEGLGRVSRILLQTGQSYYLCVFIRCQKFKTLLTYPFQGHSGDEHIEHDQHIHPIIFYWRRHQCFHGTLRSRDEYHGLHGLQAAKVGNITERPMGSE